MIAENELKEESVLSERFTKPSDSSFAAKVKTCSELKLALEGSLGDIVAKHEEMILHYYKDVQKQANQSFDSAKMVAIIGFIVLIATVSYSLIFDALGRFNLYTFASSSKDFLTVGSIGIVSGILIEFVAAINFWLYTKASKQFNAFHICLERTHRYLIAYKISEQITNNRDITLEKLVCIMANAPMITYQDIDDGSNKANKVNTVSASAVSSETENI